MVGVAEQGHGYEHRGRPSGRVRPASRRPLPGSPDRPVGGPAHGDRRAPAAPRTPLPRAGGRDHGRAYARWTAVSTAE